MKNMVREGYYQGKFDKVKQLLKYKRNSTDALKSDKSDKSVSFKECEVDSEKNEMAQVIFEMNH